MLNASSMHIDTLNTLCGQECSLSYHALVTHSYRAYFTKLHPTRSNYSAKLILQGSVPFLQSSSMWDMMRCQLEAAHSPICLGWLAKFSIRIIQWMPHICTCDRAQSSSFAGVSNWWPCKQAAEQLSLCVDMTHSWVEYPLCGPIPCELNSVVKGPVMYPASHCHPAHAFLCPMSAWQMPVGWGWCCNLAAASSTSEALPLSLWL